MFRINFKYSLLTFLGLVAFVCFAAAPAYSQTSDPQKVFVVNTTSTPVPTVAQGTTKVTGSILVGNTAAAPVVVRDVDAQVATHVGRKASDLVSLSGLFNNSGEIFSLRRGSTSMIARSFGRSFQWRVATLFIAMDLT